MAEGRRARGRFVTGTGDTPRRRPLLCRIATYVPDVCIERIGNDTTYLTALLYESEHWVLRCQTPLHEMHIGRIQQRPAPWGRPVTHRSPCITDAMRIQRLLRNIKTEEGGEPGGDPHALLEEFEDVAYALDELMSSPYTVREKGHLKTTSLLSSRGAPAFICLKGVPTCPLRQVEGRRRAG